MVDGHIHIEYGDYTPEWIQKFVDKAVEMQLDEIYLLEHNYMFKDYERLAKALSDSNMYADQNSGVERRCHDTAPLGMDAELIRALKRHNVKIITSSDAHHPEDVGYKIRELNECVINA